MTIMELKQHEGQIYYSVTANSNPEYDTDQDDCVFPSTTPQPAELILKGICTNCDNLGHCVWQHNNNTNCQHYQ
jgi:hypothetical protein